MIRVIPALVFIVPLMLPGLLRAAEAQAPIDRHALVTRHHPVLRQFDATNPLSVGNGEFAFTADVTGLQTFPEAFTNTTPLGTLSQWGWHSFPNPEGWSWEKFQHKEFDVFGRKVPYNDVPGNRRTPEINWLRGNPHRLHLGEIGFRLTKADGTPAGTNDLMDPQQTLDLWNGILRSRFRFDSRVVEVQTICHPTRDLLAVRVVSALLGDGRAKIRIRFPYGTGATVTADWTKPEAHTTRAVEFEPGTVEFVRTLDADKYSVRAAWSEGASLEAAGPHEFILKAGEGQDTLEFVCLFAPAPTTDRLPGFDEVKRAATEHWNRFWQTGGAIDLSGSADPRWRELERRIVLSQYLTAIQCSGSLPPQETGLTYNSWEGKFHLEMHWWHAAHFALWDRLPMLERSLGYYRKTLPQAIANAKRQGYTGARWSKMTDPSGIDSPSPVGPFLIWQQPHPIFYAELCYRAKGDRATLEEHREVIFQTAEFMASYAEWDSNRNQFVLGPVLQCAQEIFPKTNTLNPTFELTYWRWGLEKAQEWRERLGMPREPKWDRVLKHLAPLPTEQDKYLFAETATGTYTDRKWTDDHPSVTAALGLLPGPGVDPQVMRRTLDWIWENWNWPDTWGWDYPMLAMCAARVGDPEKAVSALLLDTPKNHYGINGHNYQRPGLTIYLPGNGGVLYAAAMMAAGWDGAPERNAPGFPDNGKWVVRWEGLRRAP
ncbi:MAG TPA: glycoside hydrolase family 65 [Verrucomicrobiota bacterium]|nr:glycoside hydrolase family 65 [Verrucomicrobiota bacterium]